MREDAHVEVGWLRTKKRRVRAGARPSPLSPARKEVGEGRLEVCIGLARLRQAIASRRLVRKV